MKRRFDAAIPELMDRPQPVTSALERDLANLRSLNRNFGSYRLVRRCLQRWLKPNTPARILDLATGSGDIPREIAKFARANQIQVQIDAIDQQSSTIEIARGLSHEFPEINFTAADLFQWEPAELYDIVLCSLALHHFGEKDAIRVLQQCARLSRRAVLVADLCRSHLLRLGVSWLTTVFYREEMTRIDARLSTERAFSFSEMAELARKAGWRDFAHRRFPIGRQAIWMEKDEDHRNG